MCLILQDLILVIDMHTTLFWNNFFISLIHKRTVAL